MHPGCTDPLFKKKYTGVCILMALVTKHETLETVSRSASLMRSSWRRRVGRSRIYSRMLSARRSRKVNVKGARRDNYCIIGTGLQYILVTQYDNETFQRMSRLAAFLLYLGSAVGIVQNAECSFRTTHSCALSTARHACARARCPAVIRFS
jgi:hypothetical protein